jgi:hypothetical protein
MPKGVEQKSSYRVTGVSFSRIRGIPLAYDDGGPIASMS